MIDCVDIELIFYDSMWCDQVRDIPVYGQAPDDPRGRSTLAAFQANYIDGQTSNYATLRGLGNSSGGACGCG